jgi:hypothetical protein
MATRVLEEQQAMEAAMDSVLAAAERSRLRSRLMIWFGVAATLCLLHPLSLSAADGNNSSGASRCKGKVEYKRIHAKNGTRIIWHLPGQSAVFYESGMAIDSDGSPRAYHPQGKGSLDYLRNAGEPGNWYGIVTDNGLKAGNPVVQGKGDPFPGYYVSQTSLQDQRYRKEDPRRYIDSERVPYIATPRGANLARLGDFAAVSSTRTGNVAYTIVADIGPKNELGEGSIALAKALGHNPIDRKGKATNGIDDGVKYVLFPQSGNGMPRTKEEIETEGRKLFERWGGKQRLTDCFS